LNIPDWVGVPLMVIVFDTQEAVTPEGNPDAVPIPDAPVVVWLYNIGTRNWAGDRCTTYRTYDHIIERGICSGIGRGVGI
jgi:hypothetical protein